MDIVAAPSASQDPWSEARQNLPPVWLTAG
jgi:hypothetical protein